jgi:putative transposase
MPMSYIRIWIHIVFGTKNRVPLITNEVKNQLINHIKENAKQKDIFIDKINSTNDHIHCLVSLGMDQNVSKIIQLIKGESSYWINKNRITKIKFEWADEYFAISVSESQVKAVGNYINNQVEHHLKKSFSEEYDEFMKNYGFKYLG